MFFRNETIAPDKGKPAARQGRKAVSLRWRGEFNYSATFLEIVWLPKAVGESQNQAISDPKACRMGGQVSHHKTPVRRHVLSLLNEARIKLLAGTTHAL